MATTNLKQLAQQPGLLSPGHSICPGCAEPIVVRQVLQIAGPNTVVVSGTGCLEVSTTHYPQSAWKVPWIHSAFENAAATVSGIEAAYLAQVRKGTYVGVRPNFVVFAGDGGTYDIGLQSLSGAIERGHRFLYVCLNNEAYMNTGIQRSSATPAGSWTTTSPVGSEGHGKQEHRKDITRIIAAHGIPYAAQASLHLWKDMVRKVRRALEVDGPSFINVLSPCPRGWRTEADSTIELGRLAAATCIWPLYEVYRGEWNLSYKPREKLPITRWLKAQGRFDHLLELENQAQLDSLQDRVDQEWEALLAKCRPGMREQSSH